MKIYNLALNQWRYSGWQIELQEKSEDIWLPVSLVGLKSSSALWEKLLRPQRRGERVFEGVRLYTKNNSNSN